MTLSLRPALVSVGPVLQLIGSTLSLSPSLLGVVTALPILMLGLSSGVADLIGARIGWSAGIALASALIVIGTLLRSAGSVVALFAGAVVLGVGIGLGNVYVPTVLKWQFPLRIGTMMGVYTACLSLGATISVGAMPAVLGAVHDDWRPALVVWAIPPALSTLLWIPLFRLRIARAAAEAAAPLWRSRLAWAVTAYMGLQSMLFYSLASWYGVLLADRGLSIAAVSADLSALYVTQLISSLAVPMLLVRLRSQSALAFGGPALAGTCILGSLYAPLSWVPFTSATLGLILGGVFGMALSFMILRTQRVQSAARLSAMAQSFGYLLASLGPLGLGLLRTTPQPRLASAAWLLLLAACAMIVGAVAGSNAFVEDRPTRVTTPPPAPGSAASQSR